MATKMHCSSWTAYSRRSGNAHDWFRGYYDFRLWPLRVTFNEGYGPINFAVHRGFYYIAIRNPLNFLLHLGPTYFRLYGGPHSTRRSWVPGIKPHPVPNPEQNF